MFISCLGSKYLNEKTLFTRSFILKTAKKLVLNKDLSFLLNIRDLVKSFFSFNCSSINSIDRYSHLNDNLFHSYKEQKVQCGFMKL